MALLSELQGVVAAYLGLSVNHISACGGTGRYKESLAALRQLRLEETNDLRVRGVSQQHRGQLHVNYCGPAWETGGGSLLAVYLFSSNDTKQMSRVIVHAANVRRTGDIRVHSQPIR